MVRKEQPAVKALWDQPVVKVLSVYKALLVRKETRAVKALWDQRVAKALWGHKALPEQAHKVYKEPLAI